MRSDGPTRLVRRWDAGDGRRRQFVGGFTLSTRSQLRFVQRIEYETEGGETDATVRMAQVYRHSDGYPSGVLPALAQLKALQDETGTERDPSYVAANFVFLSKLQGMGLYLNRDAGFGGSLTTADILAVIAERDVSGLAALEQPHFLLGYGVEDPSTGIHGDEEYLYVVELPSRGPFADSGDWTVKVSEHNGFPRWDGPSEEAFERAVWQYEGPLAEAFDELLAEPV